MNKNESGRSMVEMLGVLAIVGVLSVGGIAGYQMAMDKHKVNELNNFLSQVELKLMTASSDENFIDYEVGNWKFSFEQSGPTFMTIKTPYIVTDTMCEAANTFFENLYDKIDNFDNYDFQWFLGEYVNGYKGWSAGCDDNLKAIGGKDMSTEMA